MTDEDIRNQRMTIADLVNWAKANDVSLDTQIYIMTAGQRRMAWPMRPDNCHSSGLTALQPATLIDKSAGMKAFYEAFGVLEIPRPDATDHVKTCVLISQ